MFYTSFIVSMNTETTEPYEQKNGHIDSGPIHKEYKLHLYSRLTWINLAYNSLAIL